MDDIFSWLDQFTGVYYNMSDEFNELSGDAIFEDSLTEWNLFIAGLPDVVLNVFEVIEDNKLYITDVLPPAPAMKKAFHVYVMQNTVPMINHVLKKLHIEQKSYANISQVAEDATLISSLVSMFLSNSTEDIIKNKLFNEFIDTDDDGNEFNVLTEEFGITEKDIPNMKIIATTIHNDYLESLEDE